MQSVKSTFACLLIAFLGGSTLFGQQKISYIIPFDFNSSKLNSKAEKQLEKIIHQLESIPDYTIELSGHTDIHGSNDYNDDLSKSRVNTVNDFLISQYIPKDRISLNWFGESQLLQNFSNQFSDQENRRVELIIYKYEYNNLEELKAYLSDSNENRFFIDARRDNKLSTDHGVHLHIPAYCFEFEDGTATENEQIEIRCTDAFDKASFFSHNLSTTTGEDQLLETGGMIKIEAYINNKPLSLKEGAEIQLTYPLSEIKNDMELFYARNNTSESDITDWESSNQRFMTTDSRRFDLSTVDWNILNHMDSILQPERPYLIFEEMPKRPKQLKKPQPPSQPNKPNKSDIVIQSQGLGKLFNSEKKKAKAIEIKYKQKMQVYDKQMERYNTAYNKYLAAVKHYESNVVKRKSEILDWDKEMNRRLQSITVYKNKMCTFHVQAQTKGLVRSLIRKKETRTPEEIATMILAFKDARVNLKINERDLYLKAFGNQTRYVLDKKNIYPTVADFSIYENDDFIPNLNVYLTEFRNVILEAQFRETGQISFDHLKSYTSSIRKLGWINCDRFKDYPEEILTSIKLPDAKDNEEIEYWLIFDEIESMIKARKDLQGHYTFRGIPLGESVKLVAIGIKDSKPSLAVQNFTIQRSNYLDLEFFNTTLGEIKSELNSTSNAALGD